MLNFRFWMFWMALRCSEFIIPRIHNLMPLYSIVGIYKCSISSVLPPKIDVRLGPSGLPTPARYERSFDTQLVLLQFSTPKLNCGAINHQGSAGDTGWLAADAMALFIFGIQQMVRFVEMDATFFGAVLLLPLLLPQFHYFSTNCMPFLALMTIAFSSASDFFGFIESFRIRWSLSSI